MTKTDWENKIEKITYKYFIVSDLMLAQDGRECEDDVKQMIKQLLHEYGEWLIGENDSQLDYSMEAWGVRQILRQQLREKNNKLLKAK